MVMSIGKNGAKVNISSNGSVPPSSDVDEVPDSEADIDEDSEEEKEDEDEEYGEDEEASPIKVRRSARSTKLPRQNLPFSPKKTRSQKIVVLDTDEEDDDADGSSNNISTRRSTRARKGFKVNLDENAYYESEQEDEGSDVYSSAPRRLKGTAKRGKVVRRQGAPACLRPCSAYS